MYMKKYKWGLSFAAFLACLSAWALPAEAAFMQTIDRSPYVSFSPDRQAWTTNAGDRNIRWYREGEIVRTGITSSLEALEAGEHYYDTPKRGMGAIGRWMVEHEAAQCIHNRYPSGDYHGIRFGRSICGARYYSGWIAYCADCGRKLSNIFVYMSREAAETIDYIPLGMTYYSLCPFCNNLEQGREFQHDCKAVSANMYRVIYDANFPEGAERTAGFMSYSLHMYGNAREYEGVRVTPARRLAQNGYSCSGYRFAGWNTSPDGTGAAYGEGAEVLNLTAENWNGQPGRNERGTVILYAQWESVRSMLQINPAGGMYGGRSGIAEIPGRYGETYLPDPALINPPAGYTVTFQVNGGTEIPPAVSARRFREWAMEGTFSGSFQNGIYQYTAPEGSRDTLRALYEDVGMTLPQARKAGSVFGGWYYDPAFRLPAGGPGETITPAGDVTLYAQWVNLTLRAANNYTAFGGGGAVDLSWQMQNGAGKTYFLYQSLDGRKWVKVSAADNISDTSDIHMELQRTGKKVKYTAPYTGIYNISLSGAQGGNYRSYTGGKGGRIKLRIWLVRGEVLTFDVGGANGYNGGGSGSAYGTGGGCSVLSSDKKGLIAVAGGGGGASVVGSGGAGGSSASLTKTRYVGESGMSGGGGGFLGGRAGEYILHTHKPACYKVISGTVKAGADFYGVRASWSRDVYGLVTSSTGVSAKAGAHSGENRPLIGLRVGNQGRYLETPYSGILTFSDLGAPGESDIWGLLGDDAVTSATVYFIHADGRVTSETVVPENLSHIAYEEQEVWYRQGSYTAEMTVKRRVITDKRFTGRRISKPAVSCCDPWGYYHGAPAEYQLEGTFQFQVAEDVKGVYLEISRAVSSWDGGCSIGVGVQNVSYSYNSKILTCGYAEGEVESARPAYGGSNYVNPNAVLEYSMVSGERQGDGNAVLDSVQLGLWEGQELKNVKATDLAPPQAVSQDSVKKRPTESGRISVSWRKPVDNGTLYYHKAEAYLKGSTALLCSSNITLNTLVSGVAGYRYTVNGRADSRADRSWPFSRTEAVEIPVAEEAQYLHLAAADAAGNIGETIHILLDAANVPWKIATRQLRLREGENVYAAGGELYYVKCDGVTSFLLEHSAYIDGPVSQGGRLAYSIFESSVQGHAQPGQNILYAQPGQPLAGGEGLLHSTKDIPLLAYYPYSAARRPDGGGSLEVDQMFTLDTERSGQRIVVTPRAGAVYRDGVQQSIYYSDPASDALHGLTLVGDAEGPVISGMEALGEGQLIDRREETVRLHLTAADVLSGVSEFYVTVVNKDNHSTQTFYAENGVLDLEITREEALFTGEFTLIACAKDHVGNVTEVSRTVTEFALETSIERILEPHDPVFKCGESGILHITVYGYADMVEVEVPPELRATSEGFRGMQSIVLDYTDMQIYRQESALQFMVPLYTPADREYTWKVRAIKGEKSLESEPALYVTSEGGDVLSEFRTRLR